MRNKTESGAKVLGPPGAVMLESRPISVDAMSIGRPELVHHCEHCAQLQDKLTREQRRHERLTAKHVLLQKRFRQLTQLRVGAENMLAPQQRIGIYSSIQELVAKLTGAQKVGVFVFDQLSCNLSLVSSSGIDSERFSNVPLGASLIGRTVATGIVFIAQRSKAATSRIWAAEMEHELVACIPLRYSGVLLGAVAIFGRAAKKFSEKDRELFEAISKWMSFALYCTSMGWITG